MQLEQKILERQYQERLTQRLNEDNQDIELTQDVYMQRWENLRRELIKIEEQETDRIKKSQLQLAEN